MLPRLFTDAGFVSTVSGATLRIANTIFKDGGVPTRRGRTGRSSIGTSRIGNTSTEPISIGNSSVGNTSTEQSGTGTSSIAPNGVGTHGVGTGSIEASGIGAVPGVDAGRDVVLTTVANQRLHGDVVVVLRGHAPAVLPHGNHTFAGGDV